MSKYRNCRTCGKDLGYYADRTFGTYECCCDDGLCLNCCNNKITKDIDDNMQDDVYDVS